MQSSAAAAGVDAMPTMPIAARRVMSFKLSVFFGIENTVFEPFFPVNDGFPPFLNVVLLFLLLL
tara:strand:- start:512 stop:703 length:192 start_codon:yes stop_codon:yes gene_type:complete